MPKKNKIILIDGNSLLYRAFFALPTTLTTSNGVVTNAVYGFTSMLIRLIKDEKPDCLAVAFDKGIRTFRHEEYAEYKAHRPQTPDDLRPQFSLIKELLTSLDIPFYEKEGFEADDILATASRRAQEAGSQTYVVTSDRDAFQLITDNTHVMTTRKGITDIVIYDKKKLDERYGITPEQVPDMLGLKGDPSDNIPGVPGVGEKTATKLIKKYGDLDGVYEHLDEISGNKLKSNLVEFKNQAEVSKKLAKLRFEVEFDFDINKCKLKWDFSKVKDTFVKFEFNKLLERVKNLTPEKDREAGFLPNIKKRAFCDIESKIKGAKKIAITTVTTKNKEIESVFLCFDDIVYQLSADDLIKLKPTFKDGDVKKLAFDAKKLMFALHFSDITLKGLSSDIVVAAYLLEPTKANYEASDLALKYLKLSVESNLENREAQASLECYLASRLEKPIKEKLTQNNLNKVYKELELPLIPVLAAMEFRGVGIDKKILKTYSAELEHLINKLQEDIYYHAKEEFNIASPLKLSKILFEKIKLKPIKKTKTGYSTDSTVLARLINEHPIIENIINYRELTKLKSTYVDALPRLINPKTKRLHTTFNQTVTATGRLSSSNPNLQNIPVRTDVGKYVRKAFVSAHLSDVLLVADYSQIELRILAYLSKDEALTKAFKEHGDIHQATAAEVFGVKPNEVSDKMRYKAKAVNFGIVYGISNFGLANQLHISPKEAATYIDLYFTRYPKIKIFIDKTIEDAYKNGFVATLYKRRRRLPELLSKDVRVRNFGERSAVNSVIQGSAADIIKQAMINIEKSLEKEGLLSRMVLQVHDELVFEVPNLEINTAYALIKKQMEQAYPLSPQLEINIGIGANWLETK